MQGAIKAYSEHHHLQIRPEDVWFAIISQFNFYVNAHAEDLRHLFVAHHDKKELEVKFGFGDRFSVDYGLFARKMSDLIDKNVVDPELRSWALPAFSTTTEHDKIVASVLLMGMTQKYFTFKCTILCGLPSVTLLGEKADWSRLYDRLAKLEEYGKEPSDFARMLRPVISRFVRSFEKPTSAETTQFWQQIANHISGGSGPSYYTGWITAFCFWDAEGRRLHQRQRRGDELELDGVKYYMVDSDEVPPGYSTVPVTIDDNGDVFAATMIAGSVGITCTASGEKEAVEGSNALDTVAVKVRSSSTLSLQKNK